MVIDNNKMKEKNKNIEKLKKCKEREREVA